MMASLGNFETLKFGNARGKSPFYETHNFETLRFWKMDQNRRFLSTCVSKNKFTSICQFPACQGTSLSPLVSFLRAKEHVYLHLSVFCVSRNNFTSICQSSASQRTSLPPLVSLLRIKEQVLPPFLSCLRVKEPVHLQRTSVPQFVNFLLSKEPVYIDLSILRVSKNLFLSICQFCTCQIISHSSQLDPFSTYI